MKTFFFTYYEWDSMDFLVQENYGAMLISLESKEVNTFVYILIALIAVELSIVQYYAIATIWLQWNIYFSDLNLLYVYW